jgi:hypothetical protein
MKNCKNDDYLEQKPCSHQKKIGERKNETFFNDLSCRVSAGGAGIGTG